MRHESSPLPPARRAQLKSWVVINSTEVINEYGQRSCPAGRGLQPTATPATIMALTSLYAMQRCYSLVRGYESGRFDNFVFDYVVRLRPDQLIRQPLALALNVSISAWPDDRVLKTKEDGVAVAPQGPMAAVYFRTFASATSCTFVAPNTPALAQSVRGVAVKSNQELFVPGQQVKSRSSHLTTPRPPRTLPASSCASCT